VEPFAITIALVGIVIVVASLLSGALERSGIPLVGIFLVLGAVLGPWGLGFANILLESPTLQILATLALALVLFSDAVTLNIAQVRAQSALAWRLIGPGTLLPATITALAAWLLLGVSLPAAAILGAALASTDPVLLRTLLRSRALPATTKVALRLETGINDVVLLPIVVIAMLFLREGATPSSREISRSLTGLFVLGPALGAAVGWVGITALVQIRTRIGVRRDYESLYALGLAFTAYAAAEAVGGSGFLAAFAAGLMVAVQDVELCDCFLEYGEATAEMFLLLTFVALGTSLIWTGFNVADFRTIVFAVIAISVRTVVLFPLLHWSGVAPRDRKLIALFGPRGLSALLLTLLPVFAGVPDARHLFTVTCLVVLLSVLVHGSGIALFLRRNEPSRRAPKADAKAVVMVEPPSAALVEKSEAKAATARSRPLPVASVAAAEPERDESAEKISIDEVRRLRAAGEPVIVLDARADRSYQVDQIQAAGAVRVQPEDPVRSIESQRLSQHATLVVYCA
jgi:NhaP-type Na+/H+ or K+/H+ antiporter